MTTGPSLFLMQYHLSSATTENAISLDIDHPALLGTDAVGFMLLPVVTLTLL